VSALLFSCLQADLALPHYRRLTGYIEQTLGMAVRFDADADWRARRQRLWSEQAQLGCVCGHFVAEELLGSDRFEALCAPVYADPRYADMPVYYSDVLVRRGTAGDSLRELCKARWAYNEEQSHSGYWTVIDALTRSGLQTECIAKGLAAGSHHSAIAAVLEGQADCCAVDSYVYWCELRERPALAERLRVALVLGPSPSPPLVASRSLDANTVERLRAALVGMHRDPSGSEILQAAGLRRLAPVTSGSYREMALRFAALKSHAPLQ
jgi:ABC-type phosphate/phosphonate transport system substrate-binding protein